MNEELLMFRITDIERAFNMKPGEFDSLPEATAYRLLQYHGLMTNPEARLMGYHPSFFSLAPLTTGHLMMCVSTILGGKKQSNVSVEDLATMDKEALPFFLRGAFGDT